MLRCGAILIGLLLPCAAVAQAAVSLHASYQTYAAGLDLADVDTGFSIGPGTYQMSLSLRATGLAGFLFRGHQLDTVTGAWHGTKAAPDRYVGRGSWTSGERLTVIDYEQGQPQVRQLVPPETDAREPVPQKARTDTVDALSALMQLMHAVSETGRCDTAVRTFDGRLAVEIEAHTIGPETLEPTSRSPFAGTALRCGFTGQAVAGFKIGDSRARQSRPMHGSAWLAPVVAGGPPLPVRISFETRWFGDATMYLTAAGPGADVKLAAGE
jgi:hypothetical protein